MAERRSDTRSRHLNGGYINDFVVRSDGKIWAGGAKYTGSFYETILMRFLPDGRLDSAFAQQGVLSLTPDLASNDDHAIKRLLALSDDRLFCLLEMQTFVRDVFVGLIDIESPKISYAEVDVAGQDDFGEDIVLTGPETVLILGRSMAPSNYTPTYPGDQLSVCQYNSLSFTLDPTFGQNGLYQIPLPLNQPQAGLAVAANCQGKVAIGGLVETGRSPDFQDFGVWQLQTSPCVVSRVLPRAAPNFYVDSHSHCVLLAS